MKELLQIEVNVTDSFVIYYGDKAVFEKGALTSFGRGLQMSIEIFDENDINGVELKMRNVFGNFECYNRLNGLESIKKINIIRDGNGRIE